MWHSHKLITLFLCQNNNGFTRMTTISKIQGETQDEENQYYYFFKEATIKMKRDSG